MIRKILSIVAAMALPLLAAVSNSADAATPPSPALFGVTLAGAKVAQVETAVEKAGMTEIRSDGPRCKEYNVNGLLKEATTLMICGTQAGNFAFARYTMPSSFDTAQVGRVITMVEHKYGQPTTFKGNLNVGDVTAIWRLPHDMAVLTGRDWPNTTTHLSFVDVAQFRALEAEDKAAENAAKNRQYKKQANAF